MRKLEFISPARFALLGLVVSTIGAAAPDTLGVANDFAQKFIHDKLGEVTTQPLFRGSFTIERLYENPLPAKTYTAFGRTNRYNIADPIGVSPDGKDHILNSVVLVFPDFLQEQSPRIPYFMQFAIDDHYSPIADPAPPILWLDLPGAAVIRRLHDPAIINLELGPVSSNGSQRLVGLSLSRTTMKQPEDSLGQFSNGGLDAYVVSGSFHQIQAGTATFQDVRDSADDTLYQAQAKGAIRQQGQDFVYTQNVEDLYQVISEVPSPQCGHRLHSITYQSFSYSIEYRIPAKAPAAATYRVMSVTPPQQQTTCAFDVQRFYPDIYYP